MKQNPYRTLLDHLLGTRTVAYKPSLTSHVGGVKATILLSQFFFYDNEGRKEGKPGDWFDRTTEEIERDTGLSIKEQRTARRQLKVRGLLETDMRGMPRRYFYRVDIDTLAATVGGAALEPPTSTSPELPDGTHKSDPKGDSSMAESDSHESPIGTDIKDVKSKEETNKSDLIDSLLAHFKRLTDLAPEEAMTRSKALQNAEGWYQPARRMLEKVDGDLDQAKRVLTKAVEQQRAWGGTIARLKSVEGEYGKVVDNKTHDPYSHYRVGSA